MVNKKSAAEINKDWWKRMVREGCGFTKPWLGLDRAMVKKWAKGEIKNVPLPLKNFYPVSILKDIKGKNVLLLAAGGGQQSAIFGILGAKVTVVDIAEGQLAGDQKAAKHYGYKLLTIQRDISDLSLFKDDSFDLVYQAPSMGYVLDVKRVYAEVARVVRVGGLYCADAQNPLSQFVDESSWDGKGYRISVPYTVRQRKRTGNKKVIEFRHYLDEIFNGLVEAGFTIEKVEETPRTLFQEYQSRPGTYAHSLLYIPGLFTILARKK